MWLAPLRFIIETSQLLNSQYNENMNDKKSAIPVVIIAGFLGSGKTTLLNHVLLQSEGKKIAVIVNDFGEINIDAMLVAGKTDEQIELSNGCICCSMGESGLDETIENILKQQPRTDAIIIESSGIAEPSEIKRMVITSKVKNVEYGGLLYVVDSAHYQETKRAHADIKNHLKVADCIILNKIDAVDEDEEAAIVQECETINSNVPILRTQFGEINPRLLFDIDTSSNQQLTLAHVHDGHHEHSSHLHSLYSSFTFQTKQPLQPREFLDFIKKPLQGVYRVKGFVYFGMKGLEQKLVVQKVGNKLHLFIESWDEKETTETKLVFIGIDIDERDLKKQLEACIDKTPDSAISGEMLDIRNYM